MTSYNRYHSVSYLISQHNIFKVDVCICVYIFASNSFRASSLCICHILFNIPQWRTSRFTTSNARTNILIYVLLWTQMRFSFLRYITRKATTKSWCAHILILSKSCQIASQNGSANLHIQILFSRVKFILLLNAHCVKMDSRQPGFIRVTFRFCLWLAIHTLTD